MPLSPSHWTIKCYTTIQKSNRSRGASVYLVHSTEDLSRVGDSLHGSGEDVQRQPQPLQDLTALTVHTQVLQCL